MNKQGIMVKFLVTLLLAIIIFAPACVISSKIFRIGSQADHEFGQLVSDIQDTWKNSKVGEKKTHTIFLDEKAALLYFSQPHLFVEVSTSDGNDYAISALSPPKCDTTAQNSCLCLYRKSELQEEESYKRIVVKPVEFSCKQFDFKLVLPSGNCGFGEPKEVNGYSCEGGFIIDRDVLSEERDSYYKNYRRTNVLLEKQAEGVGIYLPSDPKTTAGLLIK